MAIDFFVLQIMISSKKPWLNIGNIRLVPGFSQGPNSLGKASALANWVGFRESWKAKVAGVGEARRGVEMMIM